MKQIFLFLPWLLGLLGCAQAEIREVEKDKPVLVEPVLVEESEEAQEEERPEAVAIETEVNGSPIIVVNKKHGLDPDYAPGEDSEALMAFYELRAQMQREGLDIGLDYSGFRSYAYQSALYDGYVETYGQKSADTFSARPGFSEHQTGLAFDLKHESGELVTGEAETTWLLEHAADHGFIVRYLEGKEDITGYMAEPWHIRYIGEEAQAIMESGLCLEEYLGVEGGDYNEKEAGE